jgi:hypothetical protein
MGPMLGSLYPYTTSINELSFLNRNETIGCHWLYYALDLYV